MDGIDQSVAHMHRPPNAHTPLPLPTLPYAHSRVRQSPAIENVGARGGTPNVNLGHSQRVVRHQIHPAVAPEPRPRILGNAALGMPGTVASAHASPESTALHIATLSDT